MRRINGQTLFLGATVLLAALASVYLVVGAQRDQLQGSTIRSSQLTLKDIPFDGEAAMQWIVKLCELGPRMSGSQGMLRQREMLREHFQSLGGKVELQEFAVRHPEDGSRVDMANVIVRWHPERAERILLCAHYDTRPFPDRDPDRNARRGVFVGANDGASGVAVLAELGKAMKSMTNIGVDFALFDGEEFVFDDNDRYFLGSEFFAQQYAAETARPFRYRAAVLLDMVGDANLDLWQELNGLRWKDSRWIVQSIWDKAADLGVTEFVKRPMKVEITDDHIMLHDVGGIPACDIIDFAYRSDDRKLSYWHTRADTPDKCSALSLAKVGWVVHEWLKEQPAAAR